MLLEAPKSNTTQSKTGKNIFISKGDRTIKGIDSINSYA